MPDIGWVLIPKSNLRYVRNMHKLLIIYQRSTILSYKQWKLRLSPRDKYPEIAEGLINVGQNFRKKQWILVPLDVLGNVKIDYLRKILKYGVIVSNDETRQIVHSDRKWGELSSFFKEHSL